MTSLSADDPKHGMVCQGYAPQALRQDSVPKERPDDQCRRFHRLAAKSSRHERPVWSESDHRTQNAERATYGFNSRLRDELLYGAVVCTLREAQVMIKKWRRHRNVIRLQSFLRYRPPAPKALSLTGRRQTMRREMHRNTWIGHSRIMGQQCDRNCRRECRKLDAQGRRED